MEPPLIFEDQELSFEQEQELFSYREVERERANVDRERRRQRRRMHAQNNNASDDSDVDDIVGGMKDVKFTPNGSTPADGGAEKKEELVKLDPAEIGMSVGLKHLYSGKEDKRGRFQWQTTIPEDVGKPAEDAETQKWALLVRNVKTYNDPRKVLSIHSIVVQSLLLKDVLGKVLEGYPGVTVGLQRLEFSGRFEPLIHRWDSLTSAIEELKVATNASNTDITNQKIRTKLQHAELLHGMLSDEFKNTIDASQDMKSKGVMTYEYVIDQGSNLLSNH